MSETELDGDALRSWQESVFPYELGDGVHRWSWLMSASDPTQRNILWLHRCIHSSGPKQGQPFWNTSWIDIASGEKHRLICDDPLHIEPSVACPLGCGDHGFIRGGKWVKA